MFIVSIILKPRCVYCLNIFYRNKRLQIVSYFDTKWKSTSRDLEQRYMYTGENSTIISIRSIFLYFHTSENNRRCYRLLTSIFSLASIYLTFDTEGCITYLSLGTPKRGQSNDKGYPYCKRRSYLTCSSFYYSCRLWFMLYCNNEGFLQSKHWRCVESYI